MSTRLRQFTLKLARFVGIGSFKHTSPAGQHYICHVGDFAGEHPYYNPDGDQLGLALMSAWCVQEANPVIYDVGANLGYISTQLAQIIRTKGCKPMIVAFEPVWSTFNKLLYSIKKLGLEEEIVPVCAAISDQAGFASIVFNEKESLFAQLSSDKTSPRIGNARSFVPTLTLDSALRTFPTPTLLKIDVEGFEAHVIRGIPRLLSMSAPPALFLEINPVTMAEVGSNIRQLSTLLDGWSFFYVDDFEGQKMPVGRQLENLNTVDWVCNIFAIPPGDVYLKRWNIAMCEIAKK